MRTLLRRPVACLFLALSAFAVGTFELVPSAQAQEGRRSNTNLPYRFPQMDAFGNFWMLYPGGRLNQQGNMPFCNDNATLMVNGQQPAMQNQTASLDSTGEIIIENMRTGNITVTRRYFQSPDGIMRICDILKNTQPKEITFNVVLSANINYGIQATRTLADPKAADHVLGNLITDSQNRTSLDVFAGRGSKLTPSVNAQPNNNQTQAIFEVKVPANKEVALVHFHVLCQTTDQAEKLFATLREVKALAGIPPAIRKLIVNYGTSSGFLDDMELLRGGNTDVVELVNSDQLRGTLAAASWDIQADFGKVSIPAASLIGMLNPSGMRPRQLLITSEGQVIGGTLVAPNVEIELSAGQKVNIPLAQIARIGRKSDSTDPADAPRAVSPMIHLRSGDRLALKLSADPLRVATRFGTLSLKPDTIAMLDLQPEDNPAHAITLTDGSRFSGLLLADDLKLTLSSGQAVSFPLGSVRKLAFSPVSDDQPEAPATLRLTGDDTLAVTLSGKMTLTASYGDVPVNPAEVRQLVRVKSTSEDVQITLWDGSVISGRLAQPTLDCTLAGGAIAKIPVGLIQLYSCPSPQPAASLVKRISQLVADLNADDWKQRERAEAELVTIGLPVISTLKQVRANQPPEAQQRIDSILKQLSKTATANPGAGNDNGNGPQAAPFMLK